MNLKFVYIIKVWGVFFFFFICMFNWMGIRDWLYNWILIFLNWYDFVIRIGKEKLKKKEFFK